MSIKILLSPAKKMNLLDKVEGVELQNPIFIDKAEKLALEMKKMSIKKIKDLMELSDNLAQLNHQRFQDWSIDSEHVNAAILSFKGDVYQGLNAIELDKRGLMYLNDTTYILSGLYGILRPFDKIQEYRLEMGRKVELGKTKNLYEYWKSPISDLLNSEYDETPYTLLNLASNEYSKAANLKQLKAPIVSVNFKEWRGDKLKSIFLYIKQARGLMTNYCANNKIANIEDIKGFNMEGYMYSEEYSTENEWFFIR